MLKTLHHQQRLERRLHPTARDLERKKEVSPTLPCCSVYIADRYAIRWKCLALHTEATMTGIADGDKQYPNP